MASEASSAVTASANRAGGLRTGVGQRLRQPAQFGRAARPARRSARRSGRRRRPARSSRAAPSSAQAEHARRCPRRTCGSAAVSAARRSSTAASRSGSASRSSAYPASSPATSPSRMPISPIRSASAASAGSCDRTASRARCAPATSVVGVDALGVLGVARERGVRDGRGGGEGLGVPEPLGLGGEFGVLARRAARRRRSRPARSAAGRPPGPAHARAWSARPARRRRRAAAGTPPRTWRAARRPRRPRTGRAPAAAGRAAAAPAGRSGRARRPARRPARPARPTGTDRPPRWARERPSAETVRLISSAPSSSSAPASSARTAAGAPAGTRDPPLDDRRLGADPHQRGVGAPAEQQPQAGDDHGLARAGLTGHRGEAGRQLDDRVVDDPERPYPHLLQHGHDHTRSRPRATAPPVRTLPGADRPRHPAAPRPGFGLRSARHPPAAARTGSRQRAAPRATPTPAARTWPPAGP